MAFHLRFVLILIVVLITSPIARTQSEPTPDPLIQVLIKERSVKCGRSALNLY